MARDAKGFWWFWCALLTTVVALDRWTKILAEEQLRFGESRSLIDSWFSLTLVYNAGAAFGMLQGARWLFVFIALILVAVLIWQRNVLMAQTRTAQLATALLLGGVVGNLWDRIAYGYVIDFLHFHYWPVFNVADMAIVVGAVILGGEVIRHERSQNSN